MDSKGRSKCEGCAKWGSHLKFTYFEGASSFSLKYFQKCMNFCLWMHFIIMITCYYKILFGLLYEIAIINMF